MAANRGVVGPTLVSSLQPPGRPEGWEDAVGLQGASRASQLRGWGVVQRTAQLRKQLANSSGRPCCSTASQRILSCG